MKVSTIFKLFSDFIKYTRGFEDVSTKHEEKYQLLNALKKKSSKKLLRMGKKFKNLWSFENQKNMCFYLKSYLQKIKFCSKILKIKSEIKTKNYIFLSE